MEQVGPNKYFKTITRWSFVTQNGINVNLKMVNMGVYYQQLSVMDRCCDYFMKTPVNWGVRGGIYDLSQFDNFDIVKSDLAIAQ